jgi:polar amino acid transport system substrate-binding protein
MKVILFFFIFVGSLYGSQIITLVGDKSYPPYSFEKDGKPKGVYVDIIKSAFKKIDGYDVEFKMVAWKRAMAFIKSGKYIGYFPPYNVKERAKWSKLSEPILSEATIVFAKETILNGKKRYPQDFYGLTLCMNRGFSIVAGAGEDMLRAIKNKKIKYIEANDNKACLNRVSRGMADFYINDQFIDISKFSDIKRGLQANENFGHIGFTLKTKAYPFIDELQKKFNKTILNMKSSGEIEKIVKNYK